jgi:hypothetical protein
MNPIVQPGRVPTTPGSTGAGWETSRATSIKSVATVPPGCRRDSRAECLLRVLRPNQPRRFHVAQGEAVSLAGRGGFPGPPRPPD